MFNSRNRRVLRTEHENSRLSPRGGRQSFRNRRSIMNASRYRPNRTHLKPIVLALALVVPETAVLAASMDDVVRTRSDQNIDQQYGRDSVYAFSADAKPLKP